MMVILKRSRLSLASSHLRRLITTNPRRIVDEGDWFYASEWWGNGDSDENTVFRSVSDKGNGVVSVVASHSSRPYERNWHKTETWLSQRYAELHPRGEQKASFKILGYQWRTLRFNDDTRQSTVKVMAAYNQQDPGSIFLRQEPHCLAVPYLKSMVSAGLASVSCNYDLESVVNGKNSMKILCIGHGGGSLPLFLAYKIPGATIHIVEIDPVVISASTQAMGFPSYSTMNQSGARTHSKPSLTDEILWKGIHERLLLFHSDAEHFITNTANIYDMIFIDAYDGDDIFPHKLWDPDSVFLKTLGERLHPKHGTCVVNLHSDVDMVEVSESESVIPMGKYVSQVCKAYKKMVVDVDGVGVAFTVHVPWVCNASLVVTKSFKDCTRDVVLNSLVSKSLVVENVLDLQFSCLQYVKRGLMFVE
ncbi:unnamed protein product [Lactuca saligna]|uniref:Uncharacterized protein n=1 Tax=Lactuca saligna TaxID=75948 RepID=A0AA35W0G5_LACSI|nr:unnamed protein product [Lactuca saligna]